jgi:hypothetical protein
MRPDVRIAIAYGSIAMGKLATVLKDRLIEYKTHGYPINVSMVKDDITAIRMESRTSANPAHSVSIQKRMESYFSNFDIAIFLFDQKGTAEIETEENETGKKTCPTLSLNLLYEYGLASSMFSNEEIKHLYCFAPSKINIEDSLEYVQNLDIQYLDKAFSGQTNEQIAQSIIEHCIHNIKEIVDDKNNIRVYTGLRTMFYKMDSDLPSIGSDIVLENPMDFSLNNTYWADLTKLKPRGIRVSFGSDKKDSSTDAESSALALYFKDEYKRFGVNDDVSEYELSRSLLYIVDRAVFIMYLREENHWDKEVEKLIGIRKKQINLDKQHVSPQELIGMYDCDYYIKALNALRGVFLYQKSTREKKLPEKLDEIISALQPIVDMESKKGNRMVYCMAADYLALCYHKKAMNALGKFVGNSRDFYLDNPEDLNSLKENIQNNSDENLLLFAVNHFINGAEMFHNVVVCQDMMQKINNGAKYIWKSYALYNQARCEFMVFLISLICRDLSVKNELNELFAKANDWQKNLKASVINRKEDADYFGGKGQELFPRVILFNLNAEYYHALFEYNLSCTIAEHFDTSFNEEKLDSKGFSDWKEANLTTSDVLNVADKSVRIDKLKSSFDKELFNLEVQVAIERIIKSSDISKSEKKKLIDIFTEANNASLQDNDTKKKAASSQLGEFYKEKTGVVEKVLNISANLFTIVKFINDILHP